MMDTVKEVDRTFLLIFVAAAALFLIIAALVVIVLIRYHHGRHPQAAPFKDSALAEFIWVAVPSLIVMAMFISGWKSYLALQRPPEGAMRVEVTARKWSWTFAYENGRTANILYVPVNRAVLLRMTSVDVLHSFFAPAFRIKRDAVPGMTTSLWFRSSKVGTFDVLCAEYCGLGHSAMNTMIVSLSQGDFERWYEGGEAPGAMDGGRELYVKNGCIGCHPLDGLHGVGPSLEKIFGMERIVITREGEKTVIAGEAYVRRSILKPNEELVKGYPPVMPSYEGKIPKDDFEKLLGFLAKMPMPETRDGKGARPAGRSGKASKDR